MLLEHQKSLVRDDSRLWFIDPHTDPSSTQLTGFLYSSHTSRMYPTSIQSLSTGLPRLRLTIATAPQDPGVEQLQPGSDTALDSTPMH